MAPKGSKRLLIYGNNSGTDNSNIASATPLLEDHPIPRSNSLLLAMDGMKCDDLRAWMTYVLPNGLEVKGSGFYFCDNGFGLIDTGQSLVFMPSGTFSKPPSAKIDFADGGCYFLVDGLANKRIEYTQVTNAC